MSEFDDFLKSMHDWYLFGKDHGKPISDFYKGSNKKCEQIMNEDGKSSETKSDTCNLEVNYE